MDPNLLAVERRARTASGPGQRRVLITGGAGFVGVNAALHLIGEGWHTTVLDNLSRPGTERNLRWLLYRFPHRVTFVKEDVRNAAGLAEHVRDQDAIIHLAAQVTTDPTTAFDVNAGGTLNMLEAARRHNREAPFLFASTYRVYGPTPDGEAPVSESQPVDPHGAYATSKATADMYVRDYAREFQLSAVVLRYGSVYGLHQYGAEDDAWLAQSVHSIVKERPFSLDGDGSQVRDLLDVRDLNALHAAVIENIDRARGHVYNAGGGPENKRTAREAIEQIGELAARKAGVTFAGGTGTEQWSYVSDITKVKRDLGWEPAIGVDRGLSELVRWAATLD